MLRDLKLRLRAALPPAIFIIITAYFGWNAVHGARGLESQAAERSDLVAAQAGFAAIDARRSEWEMRVDDLSSQSISQDTLDEEARAVLNLADPSDLVLQLPQAPAK